MPRSARRFVGGGAQPARPLALLRAYAPRRGPAPNGPSAAPWALTIGLGVGVLLEFLGALLQFLVERPLSSGTY